MVHTLSNHDVRHRPRSLLRVTRLPSAPTVILEARKHLGYAKRHPSSLFPIDGEDERHLYRQQLTYLPASHTPSQHFRIAPSGHPHTLDVSVLLQDVKHRAPRSRTMVFCSLFPSASIYWPLAFRCSKNTFRVFIIRSSRYPQASHARDHRTILTHWRRWHMVKAA